MTLVTTLALVGAFPQGGRHDPYRADGLLQPDPHLRCLAVPADAAAGVDGLIVVDLPPEEDDELRCRRPRLASTSFASPRPTTDDRPPPAVLAHTSGFADYVSITGITGAATPDPSRVNAAVARIKRHTKLPVAVGFGVRTAEHARAIAAGADGVVVGSALIDALKGKASTPTTRRRPRPRPRWSTWWPSSLKGVRGAPSVRRRNEVREDVIFKC